MDNATLIAGGMEKINRLLLAQLPVPAATPTHKPIAHHTIVEALVETLGFRKIGVVSDEYAVSPDGMKMFGVLDLTTDLDGCRFAIGIRNSHDKSFRLALTVGLRVFVCSNMAFSGEFTPVLTKHTKNVNLLDLFSVGVDRMVRNFDPLRRQVEFWRNTQISDDVARLTIYEAFVEQRLDVARSLMPEVHRLYFDPIYPEFSPRTMWSLSNAFTSALKTLDPIPQFKATARLGTFLEQVQAKRFPNAPALLLGESSSVSS